MKTKLPRINQSTALTRIELLLVLVVLAFLFGVWIPAISKSGHRTGSKRIDCVSNLKQLGTGFRMWANDNDEKFPMEVSITNGGTMDLLNTPNVFPHFQILSNKIQTPKVLVCPEDARRKGATNLTTDLNNSKISYFVGVDAIKTNSTMFLAGDRNISVDSREQSGLVTLTTNQVVGWTRKIHKNQGNILFVDGHVEQLSIIKLREALQNTGITTNRLAFP